MFFSLEGIRCPAAGRITEVTGETGKIMDHDERNGGAAWEGEIF
jgi:hypothetical protein